MGKQTINTYEQIVQVARGYLGPAAQRFIDRLVRNHLHKSPEAITEQDVEHLVGWVKLAMGLLSEDQDMVQEFTDRLLAIRSKKAT